MYQLIRCYSKDAIKIQIAYLCFTNPRKFTCFFYTVHLIKSIRNNLLNYRRFLFPSFSFNNFKDPINFQDGELSWKTFHEVNEKDALLEAHLKKAPKINSKVLHPGNCKQNVPAALAIFDETTSAAIEQYFPEWKEAAKFFQLERSFFRITFWGMLQKKVTENRILTCNGQLAWILA